MYYKIENKESKVYKELLEMRNKELIFEEENKQLIFQTYGEFDSYLGTQGQQNLGRVTHYVGFKFKNQDSVDLNTWKRHAEHHDIFIPNKRTKSGKAASKLIAEMKRGRYSEVFDILGLDHYGRFTFPFVEIVDGKILLMLDDKQEPKDENLIEITKKEFQETRKCE